MFNISLCVWPVCLYLTVSERTVVMRTYMITVCVLILCVFSFAAPATWTQSVTYNGDTITMQLTKENLRGSQFELWEQNRSGRYDPVTPVEERSYIGTVAEYPDAISCGILGAVYFDTKRNLKNG